MARSDLDPVPLGNTEGRNTNPNVRRQEDRLWSNLMDSVATARIQIAALDAQRASESMQFHWNGSEVVLCSISPVEWSGLDGVDTVLCFESADDRCAVRAVGTATSDQVTGVAPEFRATAVRYHGSEVGHAMCDALPDTTTTNRLFVTISSFTAISRGAD